eukprot:GEZU01021986.1.p1 GENE.GEZU01021986.1~~GEZU01021986.1.p1  ORF type:complete len:190 (+),score=60.39 GEZU01021986.1:203-772(+)
MESEFLREMTCSERLTLEEEYKMQQAWLNDDNKCTFILLDAALRSDSNKTPVSLASITEGMCGDVNIFLTPDYDSEDSDSVLAEMEVMIAEENSRRKGIGTEAVLLMMSYAVKYLNIQRFVAKILAHNTSSIDMFTNKLGYKQTKYSEVFEEYTFEYNLADEEDKEGSAKRKEQLLERTAYAQVLPILE